MTLEGHDQRRYITSLVITHYSMTTVWYCD